MLIRHLWQLEIVVLVHWCLIQAFLLGCVAMLIVVPLKVVILSVVLPDCRSAERHYVRRRVALSAVENKGFRFICRRAASFHQLDVLSNDKMKNKLTTLGRYRSLRVK